jgi:hypothetical protein
VSAVAPPTITVQLVVDAACVGVVAARTALSRYGNHDHAMGKPPLLGELNQATALACSLVGDV